MNESKFLTPAQVAELLQMETETVQGWLRTGRLKGIKIGRYWRIREEALDQFIKEAEQGSEEARAFSQAVQDAWEAKAEESRRQAKQDVLKAFEDGRKRREG